MELIHVRNEALKSFMGKGAAEKQENLRETRKNLLRKKREQSIADNLNSLRTASKKTYMLTPKKHDKWYPGLWTASQNIKEKPPRNSSKIKEGK